MTSSAKERPVAIVTGGANGIGRACCNALAAAGFDIACIDVAPSSAAAGTPGAAQVEGASSLYIESDIADIAAHAAVVARIVERFGRIDCLVNNAGVTSLVRGDMLELTPESFDRSVAINLRGTFFLTQAVARSMLADAPAGHERYRSIVTITSVNAEIVGLNRADYCITKAGLSMFNRLLAARLAPHGIHAFEIRPGIIRTDMTRPATGKYDALIEAGGVPMERWGLPEDVAGAVATVARGLLPFDTGEILNIGGGLHLHRI